MNIAGKRAARAALTKTISAMLSSIDPSLLVQFVFLAIYPSIISLTPHAEYIIQNSGLYGGVKNITIDIRILDMDMILGVFFIIKASLNTKQNDCQTVRYTNQPAF